LLKTETGWGMGCGVPVFKANGHLVPSPNLGLVLGGGAGSCDRVLEVPL
jgi:hypothetical protein